MFGDPRLTRFLRTGAGPGAFAGVVGAVEILAGNARTINPAAVALVVPLWTAVGAAAGAGTAVLGARAAPLARIRPDDGAAFLSLLFAGHLFLPAGLAPLLALVLWLLRFLRRRLLPRRTRPDAAFAPALLGATLLLILSLLPAQPPALSPAAPLAPGTPVRGSVAVTISVHTDPAFPHVAAVHLPVRQLIAAPVGRRAAVYTGRVPQRTRLGPWGVRRLPGGGGLVWLPDRPLLPALTALVTRPDPDPVGPGRTAGSVAALAAAAGIPVLTGPPRDADPALHLRLLEQPAAPDDSLAARLKRTGAWLDVTLVTDGGDELALAGQGIALGPPQGEATLLDVAPTALHLLGLAIPRDCDGRVLVEQLAPGGPGGRAPRYRDLAPALAPSPAAAATSDPTTSR
jgi:hypothetical protein